MPTSTYRTRMSEPVGTTQARGSSLRCASPTKTRVIWLAQPTVLAAARPADSCAMVTSSRSRRTRATTSECVTAPLSPPVAVRVSSAHFRRSPARHGQSSLQKVRASHAAASGLHLSSTPLPLMCHSVPATARLPPHPCHTPRSPSLLPYRKLADARPACHLRWARGPFM